MIHVTPAGCSIPPLALDRKDPSPKSRWIRARKAEARYSARLRKVAHYIETILRQFDANNPERNGWITRALTKYAEAIDPWARSVGESMIAEVAARDRKAWQEASAEIGRALHREIYHAPLGTVIRQRLDEQVRLIKSIPLEAAERVHRLTVENSYTGERFTTIADKIMEGGNVSRSKADLIARTEVGRTLTGITMARAESVGSTHFVWRTSNDYNVRPSHRALNGRTFRWSDPPVCDPPDHRALPGSIWNCRCWSEPVIPDVD